MLSNGPSKIYSKPIYSFRGQVGRIPDLAKALGIRYAIVWKAVRSGEAVLVRDVTPDYLLKEPVSKKAGACVRCGTSFFSFQAERKYCSKKCMKATHRPRVQPRAVNCKTCGVEFKTKFSTKVFCSGLCCRRFGKAPALPRQPRPKKPDYAVSCGSCERPFITRHPHHKFCSARCRDDLTSKIRREAWFTSNSGECPYCLRPLPIPRPSNQKFCSDRCSGTFRDTGKPQQHFPVTFPGECLVCSSPLPIPRMDNCRYCSPRCRERQIHRNRRKNPLKRVRDSINRRLKLALRRTGQKKQGSILKYFGCSAKDMVFHIESQFELGMSWSNHGQGTDKWHIDHLIPVARFNLSYESHRSVCFHFLNLRPYWQNDNLHKGNRLAHRIPSKLIKMARSLGLKLE